MKSRHKETEVTFPAMIKDFGVVLQAPLRLRVSRVASSGLNTVELSAPFYAFTTNLVEKVCGARGVMLTGGVMIPWDRLEDHQQLIIVRQPLSRLSGLPMVVLNSLVRPGLRNIR